MFIVLKVSVDLISPFCVHYSCKTMLISSQKSIFLFGSTYYFYWQRVLRKDGYAE